MPPDDERTAFDQVADRVSIPAGGARVQPLPLPPKLARQGHGLDMRRVSEIEARPIRWLWPRTIARGKVSMIAGHPGLGKSQLGLGVAAIVTTGGRWPVSGARAERGSAVILSAEDDPEDTIRPRLEAAGADLDRCHIVAAVREDGGSRRGFSIIDDLPRLEAALSSIGDAVLVVIDPITAYLGSIDSHRNAEVRAALAPLAELAARSGVAIVAISHLRKTIEGSAILSVSGSLAFVAAARATYLVMRDQDAAGRNLLLPAKNNLGDDKTGYAFRIEPGELPRGIATSRLAWEPDAVMVSADQAMAPREGERSPRQFDVAADWLRTELAAGRVPTTELQQSAKAAGLPWATVRRAADMLQVVIRREGFGREGRWFWSLSGDPTSSDEIEL